MQKRILIVGAGEVGLNTAKRLFEIDSRCEIIMIEQDPELAKSVNDQHEFTVITGSGTCPEVLIAAEIFDSEMFFAVTDSDEVNLLSCLVAKKLIDQRSVSEAQYDSDTSPVRYARVRNISLQHMVSDVIEIDVIINPEMMCAERIVELIKYHQLIDSLSFEAGLLKLYGIKLPPESRAINRSLREYTANTQLTIAALRKERSSEVIIPQADEILQEGDDIYISATVNDFDQIYREIVPTSIKSPHVFIAGASRVGKLIAHKLSEQNITLTIFDPRDDVIEKYERERGAETLTFLKGSITDAEFLKREKIGNADTLITCSDDDEENLVCAILAKHFGCQRVLMVNNRSHYTDIIHNLGFEVVFSPRQLAVNELMQRMVNTLSIASHILSGSEDVEIREFKVTQESPCIGLQVSQLNQFKWPKENALIASILRNRKAIMPSGNTVIERDDLLFIISHHEHFETIEKIFEAPVSHSFWLLPWRS